MQNSEKKGQGKNVNFIIQLLIFGEILTFFKPFIKNFKIQNFSAWCAWQMKFAI